VSVCDKDISFIEHIV